jgi:hypothetical protein
LPVDPDPIDRTRLVVRTVLTRGVHGGTERRLARSRRRRLRAAERNATPVVRQRRAGHDTSDFEPLVERRS